MAAIRDNGSLYVYILVPVMLLGLVIFSKAPLLDRNTILEKQNVKIWQETIKDVGYRGTYAPSGAYFSSNCSS